MKARARSLRHPFGLGGGGEFGLAAEVVVKRLDGLDPRVLDFPVADFSNGADRHPGALGYCVQLGVLQWLEPLQYCIEDVR